MVTEVLVKMIFTEHRVTVMHPEEGATYDSKYFIIPFVHLGKAPNLYA